MFNSALDMPSPPPDTYLEIRELLVVPGPGEEAEVQGVHVEGRDGLDQNVARVGQHQGGQEVTAHLEQGRVANSRHISWPSEEVQSLHPPDICTKSAASSV